MEKLLTMELFWFLFGALLLALELVIPGVVLVFFGAGAWVTAIVSLFFDPSLEWQLALFSVISVLSLVFLRKLVKRRFFGEPRSTGDTLEDEFIGRTATAAEDFDGNGKGKVDFRGTSWNAVCESEVRKGEQVRIREKQSITLYVEPEHSEP